MIQTSIPPENGIGWTLWRWKWRVELWYLRKSLGAHTHPGQHIEIMPIWGRTTFHRINPATGEHQRVSIGPWAWFHLFSIPAGWTHWFEGCPVCFINFTKGPSPAENFVKL